MKTIALVMALAAVAFLSGCEEGTEDTTAALLTGPYVAPWASDCAGSGSDYKISTFTINASGTGTLQNAFFTDSLCATAAYTELITFAPAFGSEITVGGNASIELDSVITAFTITPHTSAKLTDLSGTSCTDVTTWTLNVAADVLASTQCGLSGVTAWFDILRIDSSPNPDVLYTGGACADAADPPCVTAGNRPTTFDTTMYLKQ